MQQSQPSEPPELLDAESQVSMRAERRRTIGRLLASSNEVCLSRAAAVAGRSDPSSGGQSERGSVVEPSPPNPGGDGAADEPPRKDSDAPD